MRKSLVLREVLQQQSFEPYYETQSGAAYLGNSLHMLPHVPEESVNLILTSPPFALTRKKEYGNKSAEEYVDWFLQFAPEFRRVLAGDGSLAIDLGGAYLPGHPVRTIYQFELLVRLCKDHDFFLAQEFFHYNPARLPAPAEWVNVRRIRVKDSVNVVWWLSKNENPKADNRKVLKPYSASMEQLLKNGYTPKLRPSGHDIEEDMVLDPFAGSNTTGAVAERFGRQWAAFELRKDYLDGSRFRFSEELHLFPAR